MGLFLVLTSCQNPKPDSGHSDDQLQYSSPSFSLTSRVLSEVN